MNKMAAGFTSKAGSLPPRRTFLDRLFSTSFYAASLKSRTPKKLIASHVDAIPGRGEKADHLFQGHFEFAGFGTHVSNAEPWFATDMPLHWHLELHRFSWLRDFAANNTDAAKRHVRALLISWIRNFGDYTSYLWDADILARRLINWVRQAGFLMTANEGDFNYQFLKSVRHQYSHLLRLRKYIIRSQDKLTIDLALYLCASSFPDGASQKQKLLDQLLVSIDKTILADGCHISRNPSRHQEVMADLIGLKHDFLNDQEEIPKSLMDGIDRLAPVVRFFQHGDGGLALFNGAILSEDGDCDHLLAIADAPGRSPHRCPLGGFERLKAGRALLLMETGEGGRPKELQSHFGIGSFEFSYGRERLVVNCGAHSDAHSHWGKALASTAAHSTLSITDLNAAFPLPGKKNAPSAEVSTHEEGGNLWLELINPGYLEKLGALHTRRLFLDASGENLRGEDTVSIDKNTDQTTEFDIRFHLHPDLSVSKNIGGNKLLIRTGAGVGWQFISSLSDMSLEESVYCGHVGEQRKNWQIILKGRLHDGEDLTVKWAFRLLGDGDEKSSEKTPTAASN